MTEPDDLSFGDDVPEDLIPLSYDEDDDDLMSTRVWISRDADPDSGLGDADEADLIEQAIEVPADLDEFDR